MKKLILITLLASAHFMGAGVFEIVFDNNSTNATITLNQTQILGTLVDSRYNNLGLEERTKCFAIMETDENKKLLETNLQIQITGNYIILCESGKVFANVTDVLSSLTGTPGFLKPNYIGHVEVEKAHLELMGSGKKINFYDASQK